jgi:hypothetical protein
MSLPFRIHAVHLTSIACRFCAPSPARSLCERIRFGGLLRIVGHGVPHNVVLLILCASLRSRSCSHASCRTSPRVLRQPGLRTLPHCRRQLRTQLRTPVCSWSSSTLPRSAPPRTSSSPIAALLLPPPSPPIAALLSLLSPPPLALQSPLRRGCDGWFIDETTKPIRPRRRDTQASGCPASRASRHYQPLPGRRRRPSPRRRSPSRPSSPRGRARPPAQEAGASSGTADRFGARRAPPGHHVSSFRRCAHARSEL